MIPAADVVAAVVVPTFVLRRNIKEHVDDSLECKQNKQGQDLV